MSQQGVSQTLSHPCAPPAMGAHQEPAALAGVELVSW